MQSNFGSVHDSLLCALLKFDQLDHGQIHIHHAAILTYLAIHQSATYKQIEDALGLRNASISRAVTGLGMSRRKHSLDLIEACPDPIDGRRKLVSLSKRGRWFMRSVADVFA